MKILLLILFISINLSFDNHASANTFTREEKLNLLEFIPNKLKRLWNNDYIKACWNQGKLGSDKALSALYLIGTSEEIIFNASKRRQSILATSKNTNEVKRKMRKEFSFKDYKDIEKSVLALPKSWKYCELVYKQIENQE